MERFVRALESCFWGGGGEHEGMGLRQWWCGGRGGGDCRELFRFLSGHGVCSNLMCRFLRGRSRTYL